ncbi:MAG TPA: Xaa-Pro peptidase family protein [Phycisphaeraceae bacterium]
MSKAGLSREGCLKRQRRLQDKLKEQGLSAALLTEPAHVMYLCNYWGRQLYPAAALVPAEGPVSLSVPTSNHSELVADQIHTYETSRLSTMIDDLPTSSLQPLLEAIRSFKRIGCDVPTRPWLMQGVELVDLVPTLLSLRRAKDDDEVAMLRLAIQGCEAAYAEARRVLKPGVSELTVFARMQAAAVEAVGEPIGEMGNDFQAGTPGGPPRQRPTQAGELMPLDVSVTVRGYSCDLCRTFAVDGQPSSAQRDAAQKVAQALEHVERTARAGTSCKELYQQVHDMLDGYRGWAFFHHLGHGIGLFPHEAPRLNPNWDDVLQAGDVFTAEPGLYADELRGGVRIEQNYLVTENGLERLSHFPIDL